MDGKSSLKRTNLDAKPAAPRSPVTPGIPPMRRRPAALTVPARCSSSPAPQLRPAQRPSTRPVLTIDPPPRISTATGESRAADR